MIKYELKCPDGHRFESWFQSSDAYEALISKGHVSCAICGSVEVGKAIMAPRVAAGNDAPLPVPAEAPLSKPANPMEAALRKFRDHVESNAEDVGRSFASEARAIHLGEAPQRAIFGEAKVEEAKSLLEDGIEVAPLPFRSSRNVS